MVKPKTATTTSTAETETDHARVKMVPFLVGRVVLAALMLWIGWIHLHLWNGGYRHIPTIGPLFLFNAVAAVVLAAAVLTGPRRLLALAAAGAAGFSLGTFGGLLISVNVGLFGFRDSLDAPFARQSMGLELAAFALGALLAAGAWRRHPGLPFRSGRTAAIRGVHRSHPGGGGGPLGAA